MSSTLAEGDRSAPPVQSGSLEGSSFGSTGASGGGGSMNLPPKNEELKKQEEAALHGADLTVDLHLPDERHESFKVKSSSEVGYVKLLLAQRLHLSSAETKSMQLLLAGKPLIDPMSLCDYTEVIPPITRIDVRFNM